MIDVKQAVHAARDYLIGLYQDVEIKDLLLEEVELTEDEKSWKITLGFSVPQLEMTAPGVPRSKALAELLGTKYDRKYKLFTVDANDGTVKSMKVRTI